MRHQAPPSDPWLGANSSILRGVMPLPCGVPPPAKIPENHVLT